MPLARSGQVGAFEPGGHGVVADGFEARSAAKPARAVAEVARREGSREALEALRDTVAERMSTNTERLEQLRQEAIAVLSKKDFTVLDTAFLFPEGFGEQLHAALRGHAGVDGRAILDVGRGKYRVPPKVRSEVEAVLGPLFAFANDIVREVARRDYAPVSPTVEMNMQELRALPAGLNHDPEAERWHRDGSAFTVSVAIWGRGTEIAPDARLIGDKLYQVDPARLVSPRLGELVIMSGGARREPWRGTVHRAPGSSEPRLVLIAFAYCSAPAERDPSDGAIARRATGSEGPALKRAL